MNLEKLLDKIKKETEEEISALKVEHAAELDKIKKEKESEIEKIRKEKEIELEKERKKVLIDYEKEKEFEMKMMLLGFKRELLEEAAAYTKQEVKKLSSQEKKDIFKKIVERRSSFLDDKCLVFVPSSKKKEFQDIFKGIPEKNIVEKEKLAEDSFVIESQKFVFAASLEDVVDETANRENSYFSNILFGN